MKKRLGKIHCSVGDALIYAKLALGLLPTIKKKKKNSSILEIFTNRNILKKLNELDSSSMK